MDYLALFQVSALGMATEKKRLEVATLNLANMHRSAPDGVAGYRPLRAVVQADVQSLAVSSFATAMTQQATAVQLATPSVQVVAIDAPPRLVRDPAHPHADAQGFVKYPAVEQATEMVTAISAMRAYEANVAPAGFARAMASRALDIGSSR